MSLSTFESIFSGAAPDGIALRRASSSMSYGELRQRTEHLANYLAQAGVKPGAAVAVGLCRSFEWVISCLAAMRVGAAYVPMDLAWPEDRLRHVLADSGASVLIADVSVQQRLFPHGAGVEQGIDLRIALRGVDLRKDADRIAAAPAHLPVDLSPDDLAYVIYTSGSTGVPKGVEITHGNLSHLIAWHLDAFAVTGADRASHLAGLGFDAAAWEVWPYLAAGATVSLVDDEVRASAAQLQRWFVAERISIGFVPTVLAGPLTAMPWPAETTLRTLLTGGDALHRGPAHELPFALVNNYGPTECTVVATSGVVPVGAPAPPPIGSPIAGATVYVLDEERAPVPPGQVGELYIGGTGVGRGYRNLPQLTAASFPPDPFSATPGARMYRTGDRGLVLADGQIAFRGRADTQEKIRGHRVELDEINAVLHRHPGIAFGVVLTAPDAMGEKQLVAHVLPAGGAQLSAAALQEFLARALPAYMVPAQFVLLRHVPLTANGKLDRAALERPSAANALAQASRAPASPLEELLLATVQELLATDEVTVEDDFFLVGGHSLLGTQLVLRVRAAFAVELTLRDLFETATIARLAAKVESLLIAELDALPEEEAVRQAGASVDAQVGV